MIEASPAILAGDAGAAGGSFPRLGPGPGPGPRCVRAVDNLTPLCEGHLSVPVGEQ